MDENESDTQQIDAAQEDVLDLDEVMRDFGVSRWQNLGPIESSSSSLSLQIEIEDQRYILRERPEGIIGEDLNFRYDFQHYLQKAGIPVPSFHLTPQGKPVVEVGEDYFELQEQIGGEFFSTANPRSLDWVASAGSMLARIHQASRSYPGHQHRWPTEAHMGAVVQGYLNLARARADESSIQAVSSALANCVDQWEAVLPSAMMAIGSGQNLPEFHIHGDYHALNLRFGPFGVSAVTGLEAARWEKRIFELASALFYFSALAWLPGSTATPPLVKRGFEPERARSFLHAYSEYYPPVQGEAELLTDALQIVAPIVAMNGPLEDLFYTTPIEEDSMLIDEVMEHLSWAASLPAWLNRLRRSLPEMWL
jgi:Ser/Thr protein kinase RdoA (MazF antagonist)